jgi:hypothetical protein
MKLANIQIERKMFLLGASVLQVLGLAGVALWTVHTRRSANA